MINLERIQDLLDEFEYSSVDDVLESMKNFQALEKAIFRVSSNKADLKNSKWIVEHLINGAWNRSASNGIVRVSNKDCSINVVSSLSFTPNHVIKYLYSKGFLFFNLFPTEFSSSYEKLNVLTNSMKYLRLSDVNVGGPSNFNMDMERNWVEFFDTCKCKNTLALVNNELNEITGYGRKLLELKNKNVIIWKNSEGKLRIPSNLLR